MPRRLAALALLVVLLPQVALAEQARIAVFEGVARAAPSAEAPALETFAEGTAVSVSEEAQAGWRRIRLADGKTGWIEERALGFAPPGAPPAAAIAPPSAPPGPPPPPPGAPDLRPHVYVKDLNHLSELVKGDPVVGPKAASLAQRRTAAWAIAGVGIAASVGLFAYGTSQMNQHTDVNDPKFGDTGNADQAMLLGGAALLAGTLIGFAVHPKGGDLLDVVNDWNVRHPDQQFTIQEHMVER